MEKETKDARFGVVFGFKPVRGPVVQFDYAGMEIVQRVLRQLEVEAVAADAANVAALQQVEKSRLGSVSEGQLRRLRKKWFQSREKTIHADCLFEKAQCLAATFNYLRRE